MANEAGEELARRVDWAVLTKTVTLTGATPDFALPADFSRMAQGVTLRIGRQIVRPLTQSEWDTLPAASSTPRYFRLDGSTVILWPSPVTSVTLSLTYLSRNWLTDAAGYATDEDVALLDEDLLAKALIVRWRRQKGMPFADEEAEYEAALADRARFDDRSRF